MATREPTELPSFLRTVHPRTGRARQTKLHLSEDGFERLKQAAFRSGLDMSVIVDTFLTRYLPSARVPPKQRVSPAQKEFRLD